MDNLEKQPPKRTESNSSISDAKALNERAKVFSARAQAALGWIDETIEAWQRIKRARRDTTKTS